MSAFAFKDGVGYHACSPMRADWTAWCMYQLWTVARAGRRETP
jgi:hypothetical protein